MGGKDHKDVVGLVANLGTWQQHALAKWYRFLTSEVVGVNSCLPTRVHHGDSAGVKCMHDLTLTGAEEDITTSSVELSSKVVEKPKYEEETLKPTTENPDALCPVERSW